MATPRMSTPSSAASSPEKLSSPRHSVARPSLDSSSASSQETCLTLRVYAGKAFLSPGVQYKAVNVTPSMNTRQVEFCEIFDVWLIVCMHFVRLLKCLNSYFPNFRFFFLLTDEWLFEKILTNTGHCSCATTFWRGHRCVSFWAALQDRPFGVTLSSFARHKRPRFGWGRVPSAGVGVVWRCSSKVTILLCLTCTLSRCTVFTPTIFGVVHVFDFYFSSLQKSCSETDVDQIWVVSEKGCCFPVAALVVCEHFYVSTV